MLNTKNSGRENLVLPACLVIMDGYGLSEEGEGNAISLAHTPVLDGLFDQSSWTRLEASGQAVGLPDGQMGNSEVGHLNIGAGRVVFQELTRINNACKDGSLQANPVLKDAFACACKPGAALHLMGLLSDGGVHSSNEHLYALIRAAKDAGVRHIMVHCFMDGRDVPPSSGSSYVAELLEQIELMGCSQPEDACFVEIATISGRYYAMDRDNRWERVEQAFEAIVDARGASADSPLAAMEQSYAEGVTDEFVVPVALSNRGMLDGDSVVFFNFRPDRARELSRAITDEDFSGFTRARMPQVKFVCLTEYDPSIKAPVAFAKEFPKNVLADVLANKGLKQLHIAETEKYAHVTFFLNGGIEQLKEGEERMLIPSPKVATYDLQPAMSGPEVAARLAEAIEADAADVYIVNFANCDMVGHTGVIPAAVEAVEAVDAGLGVVLEAIARKSGFALVTADHGNADKMLAEDGSPHTAHTTAQVPLIMYDPSGKGYELAGEVGCLADIAPTLLEAMGLEKPAEMTGSSLLVRS